MSKRASQYVLYNDRPLRRQAIELPGRMAGYYNPTNFIGPRRPLAMRQPLAVRRSGSFNRTGGYYGRFGNAARERGYVPELKFLDTNLSFLIDSTPEIPATGQLALIPQGDTESTRDGRQCTIQSIQIKADLTFTPGVAATASMNSILILVQDTQCNGAATTAGAVYNGGDVNLSYTAINLSNSKRFRVLKRWKHSWNPPAGATGAYNTMTRSIDYFKKCNIPMEYSGTSGAIGEIKSNNIFLLAQSIGADDIVNVTGLCRLRFRG